MSSLAARMAVLLLSAAPVAAQPAQGGAEQDAAQSTAREPVRSTPVSAPKMPAPKRPFLGGFLRETRVIYPLRVGDWEAVGEHLYDEQALGASVRYRDRTHESRWLDLYFFPAGVLDRATFEQAVQAQREMLESAVQPGGYSEVELGRTHSFAYEPAAMDRHDAAATRTDADAPPPGVGRSLDAYMVRDGLRLHSAMTLQYQDLYFIKARLSAPKGDLPRRVLRERLEQFAAALTPLLTLRSTGDCWQPFPVAAMPPDGVRDAEVLLRMKEGEHRAVVTREGLFAEPATGAWPERAQIAAMAKLQRILPGCVGIEHLNQSVPEGSRELRMEFHAPDDGEASSGTPVRLRPKRAGRG